MTVKYTEACKHCGEQTHFYWNCPVERERENALIAAQVAKHLNSDTTDQNRTIKRIYQHLCIIKVERSTQEIADRVNVSANTARKHLYRLKVAGLIEVRQKYYGAGISLLLWKAYLDD